MTQSKEVRVGIITENHFPRLGGMEFATHSLAQALNKLPNTNVAVACATMPQVPRNFSYPYTVYRPRSFSILTDYLYRKNIEKMIKRERINILLGPMLHGGGLTAVNVGEKYGLPVIVQSHGADVQTVPEIEYGARLNPERESIIKNVLKKANKVLAVSNRNKQLILELLAEPGKVEVLHNGAPIKEIEDIDFEDQRSKYNLEPDDFVIITVGRNRPIKRLELLFNALAALRQIHTNIKCLCVGPEEDLPGIISDYDLNDTVILTGTIPKTVDPNDQSGPPFPELINLYRSSDLFASTSYVEAFQTTAIEALSCGLPILIGEKHGVRDVVNEGLTGFVFRQETGDELKNIIIKIINQRDTLSSNRDLIRSSVSNLTWENVAQRFREIALSLI